VKPPLFYVCFFGPRSSGVEGQQNLARPVRTILSETFDLVDLAPATTETVRFPNLWLVVAALHRLVFARLFRRPSGRVTVVDMVHSFVTLPSDRACDRFVVLGHDSYALRTARDLAHTRGTLSRLRLAISALGWWYVEVLLRQLAWKSLFVAQIDRDRAAGKKGGVFAIPVSDALRTQGAALRLMPRCVPSMPHILVSLPVVNPAQGRIDRALVQDLLIRTCGTHYVTLWGKGAKDMAARTTLPPDVAVITRVEDYAGFLASFDLLVYPRLIGSGFHTKLAEALVLGVPCLCADWVAAPLKAAGYNGIRSFVNMDDFGQALTDSLADLSMPRPPLKPVIPASAAPSVALAPLIACCTEALSAP
jgi:hypothetical protein